ncbi:hypothetical protein ABL78_7727 [Leptomonas seymouri]|uniref:Uncharacterized protein n=1 Tax=Leptomonas seymouri TaxID=5684 RepID=A0A0N1P9N6_LEPSE|nr:hypothetical protein ABL78_7727 [Leptomonas seymouri]|eukprot:KPI83248.1 hypothetical protein ABL78_7727 [Leptomonas seymouri]
MKSESSRNAAPRASDEVASPPSSRRHHHRHGNGSSHRTSQVTKDSAPTQEGDEVTGLLTEHHIRSSRHRHSHSHHHRHRHRSHHSQPSPASAQSVHEERPKTEAAPAATTETRKDRGEDGEASSAAASSAQQPRTFQQQHSHAAPEGSWASTRSSRLPMRRSERTSVVDPESTFGDVGLHAVHPSGGEVSAPDRLPHRASQRSVDRSSSAYVFTASAQSVKMLERDNVGEAASRASTDDEDAAAHGSSRADNVVSLDAVRSPSPASAAAAVAAAESPVPSAATAALEALKATPRPDALVRSWQADVTPDSQHTPSLPASSVRRGHEMGKGTEKHSRPSTRLQSASENSAAARSSSRRERKKAAPDNSDCAVAPSSRPRDSRSSSRDDKAVHPSPLPPAPVEESEAPAATAEKNERERESEATSPQRQLPRSLPNGTTAKSSSKASASAEHLVSSSKGRSPQRTCTASSISRRSITFEPFQLHTEQRSTVRRTPSPQAYVPSNPLMSLSKEERERLLALPHKAFDMPGAWRLDMRFEEDRKEYFRQTHLVDPLTRTRPGTRQFYIPEQADLFGMYPAIPMTKDEEGNDIVQHQAPIPIRGESFVKERRPSTPRCAASQRKPSAGSIVCPPPPQPAAAAHPASQVVGRPSRGLSGFVWGYGEEASVCPGGLTSPRGRVVSDITAPYRRNPAMSTGQIGHHGGDGTLNIFRMSPSPESKGRRSNYPPQQHSDPVDASRQASLSPQRRDVSQASTSFALMQPTPSPPPSLQAPSTSIEGGGQGGRERVTELRKPQVQQQQQALPGFAHGRPLEAVLLQSSLRCNSGSGSPSEVAFASLHSSPPAGQALLSIAIQAGDDADERAPVEAVDAKEAATQPSESPSDHPSSGNKQITTNGSDTQQEEDGASTVKAAASSEQLTPTSAKPDPACPVPSPAPLLHASPSSRISNARECFVECPPAAAASTTAVEDEDETSKGNSSSADTPPPLPPSPSTQLAAPAASTGSAVANAGANAAACTREACTSMTDVANTSEKRDGSASASGVCVFPASSVALSRSSEKTLETKTLGSSRHDRDRSRRHSVSSQMSAASSSAQKAHSTAFSSRHYGSAKDSNTPDTSVNDHPYCNGSKGGVREKPRVVESGTQTEFVLVLDSFQGRQLLQREQGQHLFLMERLNPPSVVRSISSSEQRAAGVSTGVSPTRMRRKGYANTSTSVRNVLRWS